MTRRQRTTPEGFRSKLELKVSTLLGQRKARQRPVSVEYEPHRLKFQVPVQQRTYTPDFLIKGNKKSFYIEVKGRLTQQDRKKMLLVKEQHPDKIFRFVFATGKNKLYRGSPTTYGDWCDKHGFEWTDLKKGIPDEWFR